MKSHRLVTGLVALLVAASGNLFAVQDSSVALEGLIGHVVDALKANDSRRAESLIGGLVLENDSTWFATRFGEGTGALLRSAYTEAMKDFVRNTRDLYSEDLRRGPINIRVNRYSDPSRAPDAVPGILRSMNGAEPIYEVSLSGGRPSFQLALSPNTPPKVVAGDLDGFFIETRGGFRFIPSRVLQVAVQEQQKKNYEVLVRDAEGRPLRVRLPGAAITGLIIERAFPVYPNAAKEKKIEGTVVVSAVVGTNGQVQTVTVISGPPELRDSAVETMKKWRFKPFMVDGRAVEVEIKMEHNYNLR
jgi:TonB family protein